MTRSDHSFGKEAVVTNMALLWDRPGTGLNMSSINLWDRDKKECSILSHREAVGLSFTL